MQVGMLSKEANTFKARGGLAVGLGWVAGYSNVVVLVRCGETVCHQTGNTTRLGVGISDLISGHGTSIFAAFYYAGLVFAFYLGAVVAGWMTEGVDRRFRYAGPICLEAILLTALYWMLARGAPPTPCTMLAAAAMGLQNGTITRISGAVVRTTHLTGVVTDMALDTVQTIRWLMGPRIEKIWSVPSARRGVLLTGIYGSFLTGAVAGGLFEHRIGATAMLLPVIFLTGLVIWTGVKNSGS
jgi:uncharacterized membrane protein YoaK (UPF0700 family)